MPLLRSGQNGLHKNNTVMDTVFEKGHRSFGEAKKQAFLPEGKTGFPKSFFFAGKFLFFISIFFILLNSFASIIPLEFFEMLFAIPANFFLQAIGLETALQAGEPVMIFVEGFEFPIAFTYLCTGLLEWVVLTSAVLASTEVDKKARVKGFFAGTVFIFGFNLFRIVASILAIIFFGLSFAVFSHDVFFRVFLFASIAGFYYVWLKKAEKTG